jgi:hypothetical protein
MVVPVLGMIQLASAVTIRLIPHHGVNMGRITVDPTTLARLQGIGRTMELCDESGRVVGHFVPVLDTPIASGSEPQISEEEIQRRLQEGGGRPLADILKDLEKLAWS